MKKLFTLIFCLVFAAAPAGAAPAAELWERWLPHNANSAAKVDHGAWSDLLSRRLSEGTGARAGIALFDYAGMTDADRRQLRDYLQALGSTDVGGLSRAEQMAYWINLYNALTVEVILDNYPVESILKIGGGFLPTGPWDDKIFDVAGETLSLNDIEHRILRPIWQDARIHYAVNCASLGCPNLAARAYTADNVEAMLDAAARGYVNHARGARVEGGELIVSSIYEWYKVDFGDTDAGVISHLRQYADAPLQQALQGVNEIGEDEYNWMLNETK